MFSLLEFLQRHAEVQVDIHNFFRPMLKQSKSFIFLLLAPKYMTLTFKVGFATFVVQKETAHLLLPCPVGRNMRYAAVTAKGGMTMPATKEMDSS